MRVGWIYPEKIKCGIAIYSKRYMSALKEHGIEIFQLPWNKRLQFDRCNPGLLNSCDLVHVQYEPGFFVRNGKDQYIKMCKTIKKPLVVTLHEVYEHFPGVYPRDLLKGPFLPLKKAMYDFKHPIQKAFVKHLSCHFRADMIFVHHEYQKNILVNKGVESKGITVTGHPIQNIKMLTPKSLGAKGHVEIGCAGFINPNYDYDLLFNVLKKLKINWKFTWVGGLRRSEDEGLLKSIQNKADSLQWKNKFRITGWLGDSEFEKALGNLDIALCLFSNRSSSESIGDLLRNGSMVITTDIPMSREIYEKYKAVYLCASDPFSICKGIETLYLDCDSRSRLLSASKIYCKEHSYSDMAVVLKDKYQRILETKKRKE
ncbi:hypothetical protein CHISP_0904 [Chitinispirillum alkaliphilum]|nr:hypothetical protein CHISP_0904 [Chitinispirillum alkaliphilum]